MARTWQSRNLSPDHPELVDGQALETHFPSISGTRKICDPNPAHVCFHMSHKIKTCLVFQIVKKIKGLFHNM